MRNIHTIQFGLKNWFLNEFAVIVILLYAFCSRLNIIFKQNRNCVNRSIRLYHRF